MKDPEVAIRQAELLVKLYELRREPVMRSARSYVGGNEFLPRSLEDFLAVMCAGDQKTSYVLQVYGYWDMVATMVFHGALEEDLVYDACPEMYFQFAKIRRYVEEFRQKKQPPGTIPMRSETDRRFRKRPIPPGQYGTVSRPESRVTGFFPFLPLLVTDSLHGIQRCSSARRNPAGKQSNYSQQRCDDDEDYGIR